MGFNLRCVFYLLCISLLSCATAFSQGKVQFAPFTLFGKIMLEDKPVENVTLQLLKNDSLLKKVVTTKNGKYSFVMEQDTINQLNEYVIQVTKEGTVPKTLIVNTYIPGKEYDDSNFDYLLEINMIPTTINDIVLERPSGKIKWDESENNYGIDQVYAKIIQKEEEKLKEDPDKYLKELAELMKKEEEEKKRKEEEEARKKEDEERKQREEELKKKEEEEARRKAEEIALKAAEEKAAKEKAELTLKENIDAIKEELKDLSKTDSVQPAGDKPADAKFPAVVSSNEDVYDDLMQYELKKAKIELHNRKLKKEKIKNDNLAAKYETSNVMSSLLDAVDEHDKRMKNK